MPILKSLMALIIITATVSCSPKTIQLETVLNSNQCGFAHEQLIHISSDKQLNQLFNQRSFSTLIKHLKAIDFNASSLILVSMGSQPTAGYAIQLNNTLAIIDRDTLKLDATFKYPKKGLLKAQILTSPCALYQIDKLNINHVELAQ